MMKIHPTAIVHPDAKIGDNVEIGPYCYVESDVVIGDGCKLYPHVCIMQYVKMGKNCTVYPGAVIGATPQDLKFNGEVSYVEIGDNVTIRECATINRGTQASGKALTKIGNNVLIMSYVHVAHDCTVGNNCILVSYVGLAGETDVDDWAIISGGTVVHQFSKIGAHAMVGGGSRLNQDIPPYVLAGRIPIAFGGINVIGLRRRGFSNEKIQMIKDIYNVIYFSDLNTSDACSKVESDFPACEERDVILRFIRNSKRGIIKHTTNGPIE